MKTTGAGAVAAAAKPVSAKPSQKSAAKVKPRSGKQKVATSNAPKPVGPYSQAIIAGDMIFVAGQGPFDSAGKMVQGGIAEQTTQTLENIKAILEGAGARMSDVVKVNVYLADLGDFAKMNEVYGRYFTGDHPARATVGVKLLGEMRIEVECVAYKG
jgi:2-iminobutanoate/2-iminopropanoate deaminase